MEEHVPWLRALRRDGRFEVSSNRRMPMAYLDDLYKLREEHTSRLREREIQQAHYGASVDPSIPNEIKSISKELTMLDAKISTHLKLLDTFKQYENGFDHLLHQLGQHARRNEVLEYQYRMQAQMDHVCTAGDTPGGSAEREWLIQQVNILAKQTLDTSFKRLMRLPARGTTGQLPSPLPSSPTPVPPGVVGTSSITSIQTQNNLTGDHNVIGDHNIINNASYRNIYRGPVDSASDDAA
jgi:hypothetical protein